jgi:prepilin-type N-terminal cleavage/methylation domain-containing protein
MITHKRLPLVKVQSGFTLVELLLVMALFALLLTALTDMFVSTMTVRTETQATSSLSQDGRYILSRLSYDVSRASAVSTPALIGSSGSSLAIIIGGVSHSYALSGGNLQLTNNDGTNDLNSSETTVTALSFQRIGNPSGKDTIKLSFTLTSKAQKHGDHTETFTTTVGRR